MHSIAFGPDSLLKSAGDGASSIITLFRITDMPFCWLFTHCGALGYAWSCGEGCRAICGCGCCDGGKLPLFQFQAIYTHIHCLKETVPTQGAPLHPRQSPITHLLLSQSSPPIHPDTGSIVTIEGEPPPARRKKDVQAMLRTQSEKKKLAAFVCVTCRKMKVCVSAYFAALPSQIASSSWVCIASSPPN
jgi:hypothetical protein